MLEWTVAAFDAHAAIDAIVVVCSVEERERVVEATRAFGKIAAVVAGGATRALSVRNGLDALPPETDLVLVHDAARPLVSADLIARIVAAIAPGRAAIPGLPLADTLKRVDAAGLVHATIPRTIISNGQTISGLASVQTPQGATVSDLRAAYAHFDFAHSEPTDEASLLEASGLPVHVVAGEADNLKITLPADLSRAATLLQARLASNAAISNFVEGQFPAMGKIRTDETRAGEIRAGEIRTGLGYDVHAFAAPEAGRKLFLGGVEIPHDRGLEGHSDADVLLHAVCDALLGAASLGDIGILFPNTDPAYKNIASLRLLAEVGARLAQAGWQVVNVDATVVAEAPKLMPHREAMQRAMADCLGLEPTRFSVKATTAEKMGFVGRAEGMACWAIATIRRA